MAAPSWFVARLVEHLSSGKIIEILALLAGGLVGAGVYLAVHLMMRSPELGWITTSFLKKRDPVSTGAAVMNASAGLALDSRGWARRIGSSGGWTPRLALGSIFAWVFTILTAVLVGALIPRFSPLIVIGGAFSAALIGIVAVYPHVGGYLVLAMTPLIAGIDRGTIIPVLRPSEALALLVGIGLLLRGAARIHKSGLVLPRLKSADVSILLLAITSSVVPILWMLMRHAHISSDDINYSLALWKFYAIYAILRTSVRTVAEVKVCLYVSMVSAAIVAVIAIFQALQVFGVAQVLQHYYSPFGVQSAVVESRGGSTLSLPVAVADLCIFNMAIAFGLLIRGVPRKQARRLVAVSVLYLFGVLAAGELSSVVCLVAAGIGLAVLTHRGRSVLRMIPALLGALILLKPVLATRLSAIDPQSGLPISWIGRINNLRTYFLPHLFSGYNYVLGVRPSTHVATVKIAFGYVWIESGYIWLLWGGGIPLFLAYLYFTRENIRVNVRRTPHDDAVGVVALAVVIALIVVATGMMFDPHLTYRGSGDFLFAILALAGVSAPVASEPTAATHSDIRAAHARFAGSIRNGSP